MCPLESSLERKIQSHQSIFRLYALNQIINCSLREILRHECKKKSEWVNFERSHFLLLNKQASNTAFKQLIEWVHCWTDRWFFDIRYNIYLLVLWLYYFLSVMYIWRDTSIHILYALLQFSLPATAHSNLIKWFLPRLLFQSLKNWKFRESPFLIYDELCLLVQACPHKICRHRW